MRLARQGRCCKGSGSAHLLGCSLHVGFCMLQPDILLFRTVQGLETTVEESSASMTKELERAVARSNSSFRQATEGREDTLSPDVASSAAASVRGESLQCTPKPSRACRKQLLGFESTSCKHGMPSNFICSHILGIGVAVA